MLLSNSRLFFIVPLLFFSLFPACSSSTNNAKTSPPVGEKSKPFPSKAPEVYQGDFVVGNAADEGRYFVARKGDKWRFDTIQNGQPVLTQLRTDRVYVIDHQKKTYVIKPYAEEEDFDINYFNSLTFFFFRGANYLEFEETERVNGLVVYKAKMLKDTKGDVLISIDEATGIMVRQELTGKKDQMEEGRPANYVFEVRNLKLDVDDSVFEIPSGFRSSTK